MFTAIAMGVSAGIGMWGNFNSAAAQQSQFKKDQYDTTQKMAFNDEKLKTNLGSVELSYMESFGDRMQGYNTVRNNQLVTAGYQMRTMDSFDGIMAADEFNMDYDNKVADLNQSMAENTIKVDHFSNQLQLQSDYDSYDQAISASKENAMWGGVSTAVGTGVSIASSYSSKD